jgi:guanylate kinase
MSSEPSPAAGGRDGASPGGDGRRAPGLLLVLSAPSGAGKTTLAHRFRAAHPEAVFSVSVTTRPPRGQERDGVDYHFVSAARFAELVAQGAFAEWAEVHGQRYGTLRATVDEALRAGRIALFDIDVQGGAQLRRAFRGEAVTVFIVPPSAAELERRLRGRSTDSEAVIERRLVAARAEVAQGLASYDYVVVNDEIAAALACLDAIAGHERARRGGEPDPAADAAARRCRREVADVRAWRTPAP